MTKISGRSKTQIIKRSNFPERWSRKWRKESFTIWGGNGRGNERKLRSKKRTNGNGNRGRARPLYLSLSTYLFIFYFLSLLVIPHLLTKSKEMKFVAEDGAAKFIERERDWQNLLVYGYLKDQEGWWYFSKRKNNENYLYYLFCFLFFF